MTNLKLRLKLDEAETPLVSICCVLLRICCTSYKSSKQIHNNWQQSITELRVHSKCTTNWSLYKMHNNSQQIEQVEFELNAEPFVQYRSVKTDD